VYPSGRTSNLTTVAAIEGARASGYPRVARSGDELVFAWTESKDGNHRVRTALMGSPSQDGLELGREAK
jgi:hypothetical protein